MKVRFLMDYQGQYSGPHFYQVGQVVELLDSTAALLIADGRAVEIEIADPAEPSAAPKRRAARSKNSRHAVHHDG